MEETYRFYCNKKCEYYPCHVMDGELNCLFCFCPLYSFEKCPGHYSYLTYKVNKIKDCSNCQFPHRPENYDKIIALLRQLNEDKNV